MKSKLYKIPALEEYERMITPSKLCFEAPDVLKKRMAIEQKRLIKEAIKETLNERFERMRAECPTRVIVSGKPSFEEPLWCGPKYETKMFHLDELLGTFFLSRDSTDYPYVQSNHSHRYSYGHECPPGIYYATENLMNLDGVCPHLDEWIELGDIKYGFIIRGPNGRRTEINIHQFEKITQGCLTLQTRNDLYAFHQLLNKFGDLSKGNVMVIIKNRHHTEKDIME